MVFKCQADSFLKEFDTNVLTCTPGEFKKITNGKKENIKGFDIILEDSILFPEGGGQPCDYGFLNDIKVINVRRIGSEAVHFTLKPLNPGEKVHQKLDWERRFDHMQQHSGQHLLSAIAESETFGWETTSWWLGEETSYVELDTEQLSYEKVQELEKILNENIRKGLKVQVHVSENDENVDAKTRGLPEDHIGQIRIIEIEGIDKNMCCGTHITNTSQLQLIKCLHFEKGKKGKTNLHFIVGERVIKYINKSMIREQGLTKLLKNAPKDHVDLVDKLQKNLKIVNKNLSSVLKELAVFEAEKIKRDNLSFYILHKKEAECDFMNYLIKEINNNDILLFLSIGDEKGIGNVIINGPTNIVQELGPKVCEILEGKGAGKGNKFQAKVNKLSNRKKIEEIIKTYF